MAIAERRIVSDILNADCQRVSRSVKLVSFSQEMEFEEDHHLVFVDLFCECFELKLSVPLYLVGFANGQRC